jgi:hypothetical protein
MSNQEEFSEKFKKLPSYIQEIMLSPQTADINGSIGEKYRLSDEQIGDMVSIIVGIIFKEIPLEKLVVTLQQKLNINTQIAKQVALDIALKRFLPIREYFPGIESLIHTLGGLSPVSSQPKNENIVDLKNLPRE